MATSAAALLVSGVAAAHVGELATGPGEPAYLAVLFGLLIAASGALAVALATGWHAREALACGALLSLLALAGFLLSRWIGLPGLTDRIGDWRSPGGALALLCEASVVTLAARDVGRRRSVGEGALYAVLGAGCVVALAAALVATLDTPGRAPSAAARGCAPGCLLRAPAPGELSQGAEAGPDLVAARLRRAGGRVQGLVGVIQAPGASIAVTDPGAHATTCGSACLRFTLPPSAPALTVAVRQGGRSYTAVLPVRWAGGVAANARAQALARRALATMTALRSVRQAQSMYAGPGRRYVAAFTLRAPDRVASTSALVGPSGRARPLRGTVVVGGREWDHDPGGRWRESTYDAAGGTFSLRGWYLWDGATRAARLVGVRGAGGHAIADLLLAQPSTPAWWRLDVDLASGRVLRDRLTATGHYMTNRYYAFDAPAAVRPPAH